MANPPDHNDDNKSIKTDRNLAKPEGIRPPASTTPQQQHEPQTGKAQSDPDRKPSTENLAAKS
ncbi:MAG: hypothetical protein AAF404_22185, partial [Pseudomonadota bacterium]